MTVVLLQNKTNRLIDLSLPTGSTREPAAYDNNKNPGVKTIRIPSHGASGQVGTGVASVPDAFCETLYARIGDIN